jgi:hypothetical protein
MSEDEALKVPYPYKDRPDETYLPWREDWGRVWGFGSVKAEGEPVDESWPYYGPVKRRVWRGVRLWIANRIGALATWVNRDWSDDRGW